MDNIKQLKYLPLWAVIALIILLPTYNGLDWNQYDQKRILQVSLLLLVAIFTMLITSTRESVLYLIEALPKSVRLLVGGFLFFGFLSSLLSEIPTKALLEWCLFALLLLMVFYLAQARAHLGSLFDELMLTTLVISGLIYSFLSLAEIIEAIKLKQLNSILEIIPNFVHVRFLNQWQGMIIPLLLVAPLIYMQLGRTTKIILLLINSYLLMLIMLTGGRGVVLGLILSLIFLVVVAKSVRSALLKISALTLIVSSIFYGITVWAFEFFAQIDITGALGISRIYDYSHASGRMDLWRHAFELFLGAPILGVGPMHFSLNGYQFTHPAHPHSSFMQILSEWGLIGVASLMIIFVLGFLGWFKLLKSTENNPQGWLIVGLSYAFMTLSVHSLFSGVWVMPMAQLSLVLVMGWMLGLFVSSVSTTRKLHDHDPLSTHSMPPLYRRSGLSFKIQSKTRSYVFWLTLGVVITLFIMLLRPEVTGLEDRNISQLKATERGFYSPRFWMQGFILKP